ncbi:MAG TPA: oligoendopeptidase F [bacterium]|nr:oligoendopeptidase F [bacterium]
MKIVIACAVAAFLSVAACHSSAQQPGAQSQQVDRANIPDKYKWTPSHIYATPQDFEADFDTASKIVLQLKGFSGTLGNKESARTALKTYFEGMRTLYNLETYASRIKDSDMNDVEAQKIAGRVETLFTSFIAAASFLQPEILKLSDETIKDYLADETFKDLRRPLSEMARWKPHTLTVAEEKVLAEFTGTAYGPYEAYTTFTTTDMPRPDITFLNGETVRLDDAMYVKYRTSFDRNDRKLLFESFWDTYGHYQNTFSKTLTYQTKYYTTAARLKKFSSSLESKQFEKELPPDFYDKLIAHIRSILPALHEYMAFRKEMLAVDKVRPYDMYVPLTTAEYKKHYSYEEAADIINAAVSPMTDEFKEAIKKGMTPGSGWVDVYPSKGKADGAYCASGTVTNHPFVLLNWTDDYDSLSTMAHEMGHAMHSYFSNKYQPFPTADYNLFNAEAASIFNEILLSAHLLKNTKDTEERIFLLNNFVEMTRGTVFRQALFAEFEKRFYDVVEQGSPLTPDVMKKLYKEINEEYYGASKGLYEMEDRYAVEWSYIPHFYYNYYVFQYVVGFVAALTLGTKVIEGQIPAAQYVDGLLSAGGSKSPLEIFRDAGIDMTSDEPFKLTEKIFRERLSELRELLKAQKTTSQK